MGWLMVRKNSQVLEKAKEINVDDLKADRIVMFQHDNYFEMVTIFCFAIPTLIPYLLWNESIVTSFFVCGMFRYVWTLHMTWLVNSAAHYWGKRPYDKTIMPRENWFVIFGALGEGFHNYHHTFSNDYAASEWGMKFNISTMFLDLCLFLGLAYEAKNRLNK